ncbi:MAG: SUMF1/EgtB/PvdO family nonheme iron enzyme [Deltaproteobacteria bacterium]|jgi:formylglycine-generating enzyme required for sulfatase activity|nr:SUMF1/EgtB/PvdO family nonheme iron enzyme [Deltaproteobacteria bacterium]
MKKFLIFMVALVLTMANVVLLSAETTMEFPMKIQITIDNKTTLTATLSDNKTSRNFIKMLPLTIPLQNLYSREMCYHFPEPLETDNVKETGYEVGEIIYWPPKHSFAIMYSQNGEKFSMQKLGRVDGGVEIFEKTGDVTVTISVLTKGDTADPSDMRVSPSQNEKNAASVKDFVLIKGGTFRMGSPENEQWREKDETQHQVTVSDFLIGKHEVTQRMYREIMGNNPSNFSGDDLPVENVSWFDAIQFCNAKSIKEGLTPAYEINGDTVNWNRNANGYRLPTEAEWEYACRADTITPFNTENSISTKQANYYGTYPYMIETHYFSQEKLETPPSEYRQQTVPIGSFAPNKWGLFDMHGNVGEWCWDWYGNFTEANQNDPAGASAGTYRITRGGSWNDFGKHLRSAYRSATPPSNRMFNVGFRLARNTQ